MTPAEMEPTAPEGPSEMSEAAKFRRRVLVLTGLAVVYFVAGKLGLQLAFLHANATPVSPAAGIALAAVLVGGWTVAPAIFAGALLVNLTSHASATTSLGIAVGNTAEALIGAGLINGWVGGREVFGRASRLVKYVVVAAAVSVVGASIGALSLEVVGHAAWPELWSIWRTWWLGDVTGLLIVAPAVLLWISNPGVVLNGPQTGEAAAVLASLIVAGQAVFGDLSSWAAQQMPLEFLCIPPLLWAGFRFGPRETATCTLLLSAMAIRGTLSGRGPFVQGTPNESLVLLQAFLGVAAGMGLVVTAAISDHRHTARRLQRLSVSDPLTGLANHRRLVAVLQEEIERSNRTERPFALLFLDLDDLKIINDQYGHLVGSRALCRLADVITATCRGVDTVARYGGDEFAVVLPESGEQAAWEVVRRVSERLAWDLELPALHASMGVAEYPRDGATAEALLSKADHVLYDQKRTRPSPPLGTRASDLFHLPRTSQPG